VSDKMRKPKLACCKGFLQTSLASRTVNGRQRMMEFLLPWNGHFVSAQCVNHCTDKRDLEQWNIAR